MYSQYVRISNLLASTSNYDLSKAWIFIVGKDHGAKCN